METLRSIAREVFRVGGLGLIFEPPSDTIRQTMLPSHVKFLQPKSGEKRQVSAPSHSQPSTENHDLHLQIINASEPIARSRGTPLGQTAIWELWQEDTGRYIFVAPDAVPPRWLVVDPDYHTGEVHFSLNPIPGQPKPGQYPLQGLDNILFINWLAGLGDCSLHASGVMIDQHGYVFIGSSGVGKSTLAKGLAEEQGALVLGEDQIALR